MAKLPKFTLSQNDKKKWDRVNLGSFAMLRLPARINGLPDLDETKLMVRVIHTGATILSRSLDEDCVDHA